MGLVGLTMHSTRTGRVAVTAKEDGHDLLDINGLRVARAEAAVHYSRQAGGLTSATGVLHAAVGTSVRMSDRGLVREISAHARPNDAQYLNTIARWERWCLEHGEVPPPSNETVVLRYLHSHFGDWRPRCRPSSTN